MRLAPTARRWPRLAPALLLLAALGGPAVAQPLTASGARGQRPTLSVRPPSYGVHYGTSRNACRGYHETRNERVWIPARQERVWIEPRYEWRHDPCGLRVRVLVCAGHYAYRHVPGHFKTRTIRVWVPARRVQVRPTRHRVTHVGHRYRR